MASYSAKQPNGTKLNDPFYAMFPQNCIKKTIAIWLLRNLSIAETMKDEQPMSIFNVSLLQIHNCLSNFESGLCVSHSS